MADNAGQQPAHYYVYTSWQTEDRVPGQDDTFLHAAATNT